MADPTDLMDPTSPIAGQMIGNMTDAEIRQIMALGGIPEKQALLLHQLKEADALRNQPGPEGRQGPGRLGMYTAPHPLEVLGHLGQQFAGYRASQDIDTQAQKNIEEQTKGRGIYGTALLRIINQLRNRSPGTAGLPTPPGSEDPGG